MIPQAKERARTVKSGGKTITYTPIKTATAEEFISLSLLNLGIEPFPNKVPLKMDVWFYLPKKKSSPEYPVGKPDLDNLEKLYLDSCKVILKDQQIVDCHSHKRYSDKPRIEFEIEEI